MSGHSKWSSIKHRKAAQDAKRGALFNKVIRELVIAAREGGGDPKHNATLASAMEKARGAAMPRETIERAVQRGAGETGGEHYERMVYEGRGPAGTAMMVASLTDNRNRTVADIRHIFARHGGALTETGSLSWMFERRGVLTIRGEKMDEDTLLEACAEAGAEDFKYDGEAAEVFCAAADFAQVRAWFEGSGRFTVESHDLALVPKDVVEITDVDGARRVLRLIEALEEHDDVQAVYSNWSMSDELVERAIGD
jgi:YebC/PmpR family DNA-binding regulatory protein